MKFPRAAGILLHPSSLPGAFGIGDLGPAAYGFVDFLASAGQSYWQTLPLSPTGYGNSPYQSLSAFAGNPLLLSPEALVEEGYLSREDLTEPPEFPNDRVDFGKVIPFKEELLDRAFRAFYDRSTAGQREEYGRFCEEQAQWLDDFALFIALKENHDLQPWREWPWRLASRQSEALVGAHNRLADEMARHKYRQWQFFKQWLALKRYANGRGIRIIGDIPIFVSLDSADVWSNTHLFRFDKDMQPTVVSGVPPDYFSETGQLWGHPLYRWDEMSENGYAWWISRFRMAFTQADVVRVDHFRGFHNYWEIPAGAATAENGRWRCGPGAALFRAVAHALGELAVIAEDLGDFDPESRAGVDALKTEFGFPGMRVLQFAFGSGPDNLFLPHNFVNECVVYTGTHDNDTVKGWYEATSIEQERRHASEYIGGHGRDLAWQMIRLAWSSVADTAVTQAQDLLGLGHQARMNTPGTIGAPNWCWRLLPGALDDELAMRQRTMTELYGRIP